MKSIEDYVGEVAAKIEKVGWIIQGVFPREGEAGTFFYYTVGLTEKGLPELWLSGMPPHQAESLLNLVARQLVDRGLAPEDGELIDIEWNVKFKAAGPIDPEQAELSTAHRLYGHGGVEAFQVMWPDTLGHYPDDPAWEKRFTQALAAR